MFLWKEGLKFVPNPSLNFTFSYAGSCKLRYVRSVTQGKMTKLPCALEICYYKKTWFPEIAPSTTFNLKEPWADLEGARGGCALEWYTNRFHTRNGHQNIAFAKLLPAFPDIWGTRFQNFPGGAWPRRPYNPGQNVWDKVSFSRIAAVSPRCNVGRLVGKPFLTNNIAWGEGGKVGFGPKNVGFHVKNWSMVEAVHSASLSHIILARIVWMWRLNIRVRVTSILTNVWMSNLTWLMFVTFCICSIQMWLFEEKIKRFTELHECILGYGAWFGCAEIWSK